MSQAPEEVLADQSVPEQPLGLQRLSGDVQPVQRDHLQELREPLADDGQVRVDVTPCHAEGTFSFAQPRGGDGATELLGGKPAGRSVRRPTWIVERSDNFQAEKGKFVDMIRQFDVDVIEVRDHMWLCPGVTVVRNEKVDGDAADKIAKLPDSAPVICTGTLGMCRTVKTARPQWFPGVWENDHACAMHAVHDVLGRDFLNADAGYYPWHFVQQNRDLFLQRYGPRLFIKPSNCNKLFDGATVDAGGFADFVEHVRSANGRIVPNDELLLVGPAVKHGAIAAEWRFFVTHGRVITGCQVRKSGQYDLSTHVETGAIDLALAVAMLPLWIDPIFVVDVCRVGDEYKVVELNTFAASGVYVVDYHALIHAALTFAFHTHCPGRAYDAIPTGG